MRFNSAVPRARLARKLAPLLLTVAVHALMVAAWLSLARRPGSLDTQARSFESVPLWLRPVPRPQAVAPSVKLQPVRKTAPVDEAAVVFLPVPVATQDVVPQSVTAPAATVDDPFARPQTVHERSVTLAGKIDRELRGNKPLQLRLQPDSFTAKLAAGFAAAHRGDKMGKVDHYTSPDGVIYTRMKRGSETRCFMSGTVNFVPGVLHDSGKPQEVNCPPPDSGWRG